MSEQAANDQVIDMVDYLRDTIAQMDRAIQEMQANRHSLAVRLAVLEAATDPRILTEVRDFEEHAAAGRSYEDSISAEDLINDAYRKFGPR